MTELLANQAPPNQSGATTLSLWIQQLLMAGMAMVGVGWLTRRDWGAMLERLGITMPTQRQVTLGLSLGLAMVPAVMLLEFVSSSLGFGADPDVEALTEQLLGPLFRSPFGIVTLGVAAALGEETLFRGAALPRFGLVFTSLLFALLHSNYGITVSTLIVFVLGLVLGIVRLRHNTSTAMLIHAVYNMALGLLAYLSLSFLDV
jgi:membrane protease YdiL (CAAX protease family)